MILTHGSNSVNVGEDLSDFLYLTYFNNFNTTTGIDVPIVGSILDYSGYINKGLTYQPTTLEYNNVSYPGVEITAPNNDNVSSELYPQIEPSGIISIDTIFKYEVNANNPSFLWIDYFSVGPLKHFYSSKFCISTKRTFNITPHNGATYLHTETSFTYYQLPIQLDANEHLFALVIDTSTKIVKLYFDGTLYLSIQMDSAYNFAIDWQISPRYLTKLSVTQLAVRNGDFSINDGANYPIPSKPYYLAI